MKRLDSDPRADAALLIAATPLVGKVMPRATPEPLDLPPVPKRPEPDCTAGGPHRYPPQTPDARCSTCGTTPADAALAGIAHVSAESKLREAFG